MTKRIRNKIWGKVMVTHCPRCEAEQCRTDNYCAYCGIPNPKVSSWQTRLLSRLVKFIREEVRR